MKKLLIPLVGIIICLTSAKEQTNSLDPMLSNVNQTSVTSGIIYERAMPYVFL